MNKHIINTSIFVDEYVSALLEMFSRMGWSPVKNGEDIIVRVPQADEWMYKWVEEDDWN